MKAYKMIDLAVALVAALLLSGCAALDGAIPGGAACSPVDVLIMVLVVLGACVLAVFVANSAG